MKEIDKFLAKVSWVELSFVVLLVLVVIVLFGKTAISLVLNTVEFVERSVSVVMPNIGDIPHPGIREENPPTFNLPTNMPTCCGVTPEKLNELVGKRVWAGDNKHYQNGVWQEVDEYLRNQGEKGLCGSLWGARSSCYGDVCNYIDSAAGR